MENINNNPNKNGFDMIREPFDYTKWQHEKFDDIPLDELCSRAADYCKKNPVCSDKKVAD